MHTSASSPRTPFAMLLLATLACGTVTVRVPVLKPAEVNMAGFSSVAVGKVDFSGNTGGRTEIQGQLEQALVDSGRFQVVDRQRMDQTMRELRLSASDLSDPRHAAKLGNLMAAGALIFADVNEKYEESRGEEQYQDKDKKNHVRRKLRGEANVRTTFRVINVSTGALVVSKQYADQKDDTNYATDRQPDPIEKDKLVQAARAEVLKRFMAAIVPHQVFEDAAFKKDGDLPQLEGAIGWAEHGEWKKAQDAFSDAVTAAKNNPKISSQVLGKAYWDLGLAYEYAGDYDKALSTVEQAQKVSGENDYLDELTHIKQLQADAKKLQEQTAPAGDAGGK
jgi:hypothetical protein